MSKQAKNGNSNVREINDDVKSVCGVTSRPSFSFVEKFSSLKYLRWLMIISLPVLVLLTYPVDRADYDLWWQMAHGKYYVTHLTLKMDLSIFSWTPTDPTWIYNTCIGSIVVYLFYNFLGGFGLWLFQWLIFGGVFLSFYLFLRLIKQRLDVNSMTIIAAIAIACSQSCRFYKPELFSALLFCWLLLIFFYIKINRNKYLCYLYPLIFVFWVNLHGAFLVGLVFLVMAFIGEILNRIFFSRESFTTEELTHFGISLVLSCMATLLNPYGIDYLLRLMPLLTNEFSPKDFAGGSPEKLILAYASLWPYLKNMELEFFNVGFVAWIMTVMIISLLSLFVYEVIKKKSFDFTLLLTCAVLYWKGMDTGRTSHFFPLAFFFIFFYWLFYRLKFKNFSIKADIFSSLLFIFFFISVSYFNIRCRTDYHWFGKGIDHFVPVQEVEFLKKFKLNVPLFNDYLVGGYLIWKLYPDYKVFIDPRGGLYGNQVFDDYMDFVVKPKTNEDIHRFTNKYPFKIALIHYRELFLILSFLRDSNEWRLLYFEKNAVILIHKSLFPLVQWEKVNANLSPVRFRQVKNPDILVNVFNFYVRLNPTAGRYIYDIFKNNVSDYFSQKHRTLILMDKQIRLKEKGLLY